VVLVEFAFQFSTRRGKNKHLKFKDTKKTQNTKQVSIKQS